MIVICTGLGSDFLHQWRTFGSGVSARLGYGYSTKYNRRILYVNRSLKHPDDVVHGGGLVKRGRRIGHRNGFMTDRWHGGTRIILGASVGTKMCRCVCSATLA